MNDIFFIFRNLHNKHHKHIIITFFSNHINNFVSLIEENLRFKLRPNSPKRNNTFFQENRQLQ